MVTVEPHNFDSADAVAQGPQFARFRADNVLRHDRGRGLTERAGFHLMGEIGHCVAVHLQVDGYRRAAELRQRGCRGVGVRKPPDPRDRAGKLDNAFVIDLVEHGKSLRP